MEARVEKVLEQNLETIENSYWETPYLDDTSYLVNTCHKLRKKKLIDFTIEDLRIMIGQNIGIDYLVPIAIEELHRKPLAEGDFFRGDLALNVLRVDEGFWQRYPNYIRDVNKIAKRIEKELPKTFTTRSILKSIMDAIKGFRETNGLM